MLSLSREHLHKYLKGRNESGGPPCWGGGGKNVPDGRDWYKGKGKSIPQGKGRSCQGWRGVAARRKSTRQVTGRDREAPTDSLVRADGGLFRGGSQKG